MIKKSIHSIYSKLYGRITHLSVPPCQAFASVTHFGRGNYFVTPKLRLSWAVTICHYFFHLLYTKEEDKSFSGFQIVKMVQHNCLKTNGIVQFLAKDTNLMDEITFLE